MDNIFITIDGVTHEFAEVTATAAAATAPALTIERPFVAYHVDGTRIDGYKFASRMHRNNAARCAGEGYFWAELDPSTFTFVPA